MILTYRLLHTYVCAPLRHTFMALICMYASVSVFARAQALVFVGLKIMNLTLRLSLFSFLFYNLTTLNKFLINFDY